MAQIEGGILGSLWKVRRPLPNSAPALPLLIFVACPNTLPHSNHLSMSDCCVCSSEQVDVSGAVSRALSLVGKSRAEYVCNQVVNYALNGNKNVGGLAASYLHYGRTCSPQAAAVVVGNDGAHVGIFVNSGEFVHSSSSKYQVIKVSSSQLPYVFPGGYQIRCG